MTKLVSLDDLDAVKQSETPFKFEYTKANGDGTGVFFSVLGGNSDAVRSTAAELINARRAKQAARDMAKLRNGRPQSIAEYDTVESDIEFGQRLAAVRLVGWEGIEELFTKTGGDTLCRRNPAIAAQIMEQSDNIENFMKI